MEPSTQPSRLALIGSAASQAMSPGLWNPVLRGLGTGWTYKAYTAGGKVMTTCSQQGRRLLCDRTGRIAA